MKFRVQLRRRYPDYPETAKINVWWWVVKSAGNGAVLSTSEMYRTKRAALKVASDLADALGVEVEDRS